MYKPILGFIFLTVIAGTILAQDNWNRYSWGTYDREGFAVLLPFVPSQINKANGEQGISAKEDDPKMDSYGSYPTVVPLKNFLVFNVTFQDGVGREEYAKHIEKWMSLVIPEGGGGDGIGTGTSREERERETNLNKRSAREISVCGFPGVEFGNSNSVQRFFLVEGRLYHVWVTGANRSNPDAAKFLESFTLINPWDRWRGMRRNDQFEESGLDNGSGISFETSVCQNIGKVKAVKIPAETAKLPRNTPLRLISKPPAKYPEESKKKRIQGAVVLRVAFLKDGSIGKITVVKGINKELDESAINAAKLIKFEPQREGGKFITITKVIQYNFTIY